MGNLVQRETAPRPVDSEVQHPHRYNRPSKDENDVGDKHRRKYQSSPSVVREDDLKRISKYLDKKERGKKIERADTSRAECP